MALRRHVFRRPLDELERPIDALRHLGPNWFASVMGTGILATAAALLPVHIAGLHTLGLCAWLLASALLVTLLAATGAHWLLFPENARRHHHDPAMAPFYGAPAMALLTVGAGTLLVGKTVIGLGTAVTVDEVLWTLGTLSGLVTAVAIPLPYVHRARPHARRRPRRLADADRATDGLRRDGRRAWLAIATLITLRTARTGLPFSLTWWSFTFPVGTLVTGTSELALHTHATVLTDASVGLYGVLLVAWLAAAARTAHGALRGRLFMPVTPTPGGSITIARSQ